MTIECIDVHTHFVPESFPAYAGTSSDTPWPSMVDAKPCHKHILISGKQYRTVSDGCWTGSRRLSDMPIMGVTHQAISPMPELLSYWLPLADAKTLIRYINDQLVILLEEDRGRFFGLGGVPLQDVDAALMELHYVIDELGFSGVEIASHVNGVSIGDPRFEPFFAEAERLGAAVFVHALRPAGRERIVGPFPEQAVCFPADIGFAAASMITGGIGARHPALRIGFSHGGGALVVTLPRLMEARKAMPHLQDALSESPMITARRFFYDHMLFDPALMRLIVGSFGASQILVGSDYPFFPASSVNPLRDLEQADLGPHVSAEIRSANARRFLGIT
jgi:aminocarboxymuconate-semialdehyde decarboxylase